MLVLANYIGFEKFQVPILTLIDVGLVITLIYVVLLLSEGRRMLSVHGLCLLIIVQIIAARLGLRYLSFLLEKLVLAGAVAIAVSLQSELIRMLELLGQGKIKSLFQKSNLPPVNNEIEEVVEAVKELSLSRTGALLVLELDEPIDPPMLINPGVFLNSEISKELILTIFRPDTPLHDGAVMIRGSKILAAAVILPLSEKIISRQLGTRHRAAIGITEKKSDCICIVVSEETGSISLVERGNIDRPLTSNRLKELLQERFLIEGEKETTSPIITQFGRRIWLQVKQPLGRIRTIFSVKSKQEKK
jgi:uncharacterized protein (TIGR00159 family)